MNHSSVVAANEYVQRLYFEQVISPLEKEINNKLNHELSNFRLFEAIEYKEIAYGDVATFNVNDTIIRIETNFIKVDVSNKLDKTFAKEDIAKFVVQEIKKVIMSQIKDIFKSLNKEFNIDNLTDMFGNIKIVKEGNVVIDSSFGSTNSSVFVKLGIGLIN